MSAVESPATPPAEEVLCELRLRVDALDEHLPHLRGQLVVEQLRLLLADGVDDVERERHVHRLVAEHPIGAGGEPVEQPSRAEEVDVGEGAVEEEPLDDRGEADQVQQERPPVLARLQSVEGEDRVDPPEAEVGLVLDRRNVVDGGERVVPLRLVGHVGVEEGQVELHVHRLLEELPREVEAPLRAVHVLVEVEHQVVGHDGVAGREERDQP
ncbi:hypothetical protein [Nocardioides sp. TF02-7]|uniref:hypothetical protein n=1 Tax=Nocardioides sp. TF02-7 TaxID=2917724 RepID=UPI001F050D52|nr:hypothetical protein [Nocardioides sp. TF02-7]UMG92712.1 hypothetical protein MF408_23860 [Nocardioides sp. TF02-7]